MRYIAVVSLLVAAMSAQNAPSTTKGRHLDIPAISREANGSIVSIVMSGKDGHPIAQGSGFLVSKDGRVVTNYHVIKTGTSALVKLPNGRFFAVDGVLASDKDRDVAIIKAHGNDFRTLTLGDSDRLQVGEEVVAIGNPLSLESTVSNGIVSAIRTVEGEGEKFLQITAPISHGSSGGPLFNMFGQVVGITSAALVGGENLNFAIPINDVKVMLRANVSRVSALPDEVDEAEDHEHGPSPKVGQATLAYERTVDREGRAHYAFKADCSLVGNVESCTRFNELAGNEDSQTYGLLLELHQAVVCFEDLTTLRGNDRDLERIRQNHTGWTQIFGFNLDPSGLNEASLTGFVTALKYNLPNTIDPFILIPSTDHYTFDNFVPSTDDFTFKERHTGDFAHDAFQVRGGLSKEALSWHLKMQHGPFYLDANAYEINLLTGRMTYTWGDDPKTPLAVDGRCFSTKYADRMQIRASR
jgi:V8-like Glu-specific endopeptidase